MFWDSPAVPRNLCQGILRQAIPKHAKKAKNEKKHCFYNEIMRTIGFSIAKKCEKTDS
jgi:hypothetical protein